LPLGLLAGSSVVAFAALPERMGGLVSFVAVVLGIILDRLTRSRGVVPTGSRANWHLAVAGGAYVAALVLAVTVTRGGLLWVSVITAAIVLALFVAGSWVVRGQQAEGNAREPAS
jgi:isoprenylcysteine carboxyl methyltransferase (ICMT) family protein YpbQ